MANYVYVTQTNYPHVTVHWSKLAGNKGFNITGVSDKPEISKFLRFTKPVSFTTALFKKTEPGIHWCYHLSLISKNKSHSSSVYITSYKFMGEHKIINLFACCKKQHTWLLFIANPTRRRNFLQLQWESSIDLANNFGK